MGDVDQATLTIEEVWERLLAPGSVYGVERRKLPSMGGEEFTVFQHAPPTLERWFALSQRHDALEFIVYEDERLTYAQARQHAANLAHHLVHEFGVAKGDRVALAMRNYPEWALSYMAVTSIGAVIVPLNAWWKAAELRYGIEDSGSKVALLDAERLRELEPELTDLQLRIAVARPGAALPAGVVDMAELLQGEHPLPQREISGDDDASIMYTSGSTGHPKGVVSTHRAIVNSIFSWEVAGVARLLTTLPPSVVERVESWAQQGPQALSVSAFPMPQRVTLVTVPLFHVTGSNVQFLPNFRNGGKIVLMHKWNAERALELIEREKVSNFTGVPTMSWELINSPDFDKRDTSSLMSLSAGGAARPPDQVKKLQERGRGAIPSTGYGMTETNSLGATIAGEEYLARPASVGRGMRPLVELKVVDEQDRAVATGEEGEICIRSVTNMRCYWNKAHDTQQTLRRGWIHTGDLGRIDDEGFLFITGRAKDIVIRGGENISCPEVEHALYEHPAVFEAAVYGVPDERLGEALAATVMVRRDAKVTVEELQAHVATLLAKFKVPAHIWLQTEQLPRIASGKIDKRALKAQGAERLQA